MVDAACFVDLENLVGLLVVQRYLYDPAYELVCGCCVQRRICWRI